MHAPGFRVFDSQCFVCFRVLQRLQAFGLVNHKYFDPFIIACVILNTVFLAMEYHGQASATP